MSILVKFITKSILEKKFRTFIIIFSVTISAALFFASSALAGTMSGMYEALIRMQTGKADLLIYPDSEAPSSTFKILPSQLKGVDYITGSFSVGGIYKLSEEEFQNEKIKTEQLYIRGFDLEKLEKLNPVNYSQKARGRDFSGSHIILSEIFAKKYDYKTGDSIHIEIGGVNRILTVWGISRPTGVFQHNPQSDYITAVMPINTLTSLYNQRGLVDTAYLVVEEGYAAADVKEEISSMYSRAVVEEPFTAELLNEYLQFIVVPLYLMTIMVLFISVFIIYSTFKVITTERLPVIGTFRSIGATRKMTDFILIGESLMYGIAGGILGVFTGMGVLYLIARIMASDPYNGQLDVSVKFGIGHMLTAFVLALMVALISSWIPINKASRIAIKDLVLNLTERKTTKKNRKIIILTLMFLISLILSFMTLNAVSMIFNLLSILIIFALVITYVPFITSFLLKFFQQIYGAIFGNEGILAVKNLKDNKNIFNNVSLLAIGISVILMINTISYSVGIEVLNAYKDWKFDIMISLNGGDRNSEQVLRSIDGVEETYGAYESFQGIKLMDTDYSIGYLQGIDISKYRDYTAFRLDSNENLDQLFEKLDDGRNIMVTLMMKDSMGLKIGDKLKLDMNSGEKTYNIIGFYDSIMQNGSNAVISQKYFKTDMEQIDPNRFFVKTSKDPDLVLSLIKDKFMRQGVWGNTISYMEKSNYEQNRQFMIILQAFSVLAMLIGIFGVFNNYMISFLERRRYIAIKRSLGLSKKQTLKMIFVEALTGGCIGAAVGIVGAMFMLWIVPKLMQTLGVPLSIHYKFELFAASLFTGIIISVIASISPALKTTKLDIIESIKYE